VLGGFKTKGTLTPQNKHLAVLSRFNHPQVLERRETFTGAKQQDGQVSIIELFLKVVSRLAIQ
jgi:hypothetical protein